MGAYTPEEQKAIREARNKKYYKDAVKSHNDYMTGKTGGGCFAANTQISTPTGTRAIKSLKVGDSVIGWNQATQTFEMTTVLKHIVHKPCPITVVVLEDGSIVRTTAVHSFKTEKGWKRTDELTQGLALVTENGAIQVQSVTATQKLEPVYNLVTEKSFTFIADGLVAHNFTWFKGIRIAFWTAAVWLKIHCGKRNKHKTKAA